MADITPAWQGLSELEFRVALDTLDAMEALEIREQTPTPEAVRRELDPEGADLSITSALIEQGMAQVWHWRAQAVSRQIIHQRRQLHALRWQVYFTRSFYRRLEGCLETLLDDLERILQGAPAK